MIKLPIIKIIELEENFDCSDAIPGSTRIIKEGDNYFLMYIKEDANVTVELIEHNEFPKSVDNYTLEMEYLC